MIDRAEISAFAVLFLGLALLTFTFFNAYLFLKGQLGIMATSNFIAVFGEALAPLIEACIRVMYLGVMGWIGSIITIRGAQLLTSLKREARPEVEKESPK